jgi:hypothetical protein
MFGNEVKKGVQRNGTGSVEILFIQMALLEDAVRDSREHR